MATASERSTYRRFDEILAGVDAVLEESLEDLKQVAARPNMTERDRLTALALLDTRSKALKSLRKYRNSADSDGAERYQQYGVVFELEDRVPLIRDATTFGEAQDRMVERDRALVEALQVLESSPLGDDEATQAVVDLILEMQRACTRVITTAMAV